MSAIILNEGACKTYDFLIYSKYIKSCTITILMISIQYKLAHSNITKHGYFLVQVIPITFIRLSEGFPNFLDFSSYNKIGDLLNRLKSTNNFG